MKKILLINSNTEIFPYPVAPLGISLVASALAKNYKVKIFDAAFNATDDLIKTTSDFNPDYIGVGLRNIDNVTMRKCKWYLEDIKRQITEPLKSHFNIPLIMGGSGFSIAPVEVFEYFDPDFGVVGEAEIILPQLIEQIEKGKLVNTPNVITKSNKKVCKLEQNTQPLNLPKANIDQFIDFEPYQRRGSYPVQTKRGCTHKCIYCSYPFIEGNKYRLRPVNEIVDEIEEVKNRLHGVTFEFVDSTFNSPLQHAIDICKEIIRRKLEIKLRTMGVNPGEVTEELILLMKEAGFTQIDCTPDSASERMIKNYRKNFSKTKLIECAKIIRKLDMPTMWFFMLGGPEENEDTIMETFEFIDQYIFNEDMVHITEGIRIIPGTKLHQIAINESVISATDHVSQPMFYVSPEIGRNRLTEILKQEIEKRNNVLNSIDTTPSPELVQEAIKYRKEKNIDEPMFRTLLRIQNTSKV